MKKLLEAINRGILKGLNKQNIELLADLEDDNLDQLDSLQTKSVNNKIDGYIQSIKQMLINAIQTGKISNRLKQLINDPKNFSKFKGLIKANNKDHLKELIEISQKLLGDDGNFNWIDTSEITDMSELFKFSTFNGHIELWDVSNVINMDGMFDRAKSFNQPIGDWNVSNVINMCGMFHEAKSFNQPIGDWDVSNVTDMKLMFWNTNFNQPIGDWDVSNVTNMSYMFYGSDTFNQDLSSWKLKDNCTKYSMFVDCPIKKEYKPKKKKRMQ